MTRWIRFVSTELAAVEREQTHVCEHQLHIVLVENWDLSSALAQLPDEPFVMVEWDIAFEPDVIEYMEACIAGAPHDVHVAPYHLWPQSTELPGPVIAHRLACSEPPGYRWIQNAEAWHVVRCDAFSLGLIYWPRELLRVARTLELRDPGADVTLSRAWGRGGRIAWGAWPVHLHWSFPMPQRHTFRSTTDPAGDVATPP